MTEILVTPLIAACLLSLTRLEKKKMKTENSISMRPDMARAYAEDRKWLTRRKINIRNNTVSDAETIIFDEGCPLWHAYGSDGIHIVDPFRCPYGQPGERIRLLTTWAVLPKYDRLRPSELPDYVTLWSYFQSATKDESMGRLRPGRFLPLFLRQTRQDY